MIKELALSLFQILAVYYRVKKRLLIFHHLSNKSVIDHPFDITLILRKQGVYSVGHNSSFPKKMKKAV